MTAHGTLPTPVFMPVGTQGTVKTLLQEDLESAGAGIILANTYHLALRPGTDTLESVGGLHRFMSWSRAILTDSGGYQVFSLSKLRKLEEDGVTFQSHIDGSRAHFTPESVIDIQRAIGSDIMMVLDVCPPAGCGRFHAEQSLRQTTEWARRAREHVENTRPLYGYDQSAFGIVQGSVYDDLRGQGAEALVELDFDGYAIGGVSVGESVEDMYRVTRITAAALPENRPRYLMGVGTPQDLLEAVSYGVDMFDCVMPTRNARNGMVFTSSGSFSLKKAALLSDPTPIDENCACPVCRRYSRAYVCHLFRAREISGLRMATVHNIWYYLTLMREARLHIADGSFAAWKKKTLELLQSGAAIEVA